MGQRGPKPLPANVHMLRGNPSKLSSDRLRDSVAPEVEIPNAPKHLQGEALKEWKRIGVELEKLGLVSKIDRAALSMYCTAWGRHVEAENKIRELGEDGLVGVTPNGFQVQSAWVNISNKAMEQCMKYLSEFGMSPSARSRVTPADLQPGLFDGTEHEKPTLGALLK
jgi:P27 family predicted phage terminase small subunit